MAGTYDIARDIGLKVEDVRAVFNAIIERSKRGPVQIRDFGTFRIKDVKARDITSPQIPGGKAHVPAHKALKFRAAPAAKRAINGNTRGTKRKKSKKKDS